MVVFTCNHCGDSLQKPKVEKHYSFVCRRQKSLTCVDCHKDFIGDEYSVHIKCVTEEERYAAKGTYQNGNSKKGELKQELWSETIKSILNEGSNLKPSCRNLLNHIVNFSNVPRKKSKFMNFMKSSMGGRMDYKTVEEVWDIIEQHKNQVSKPQAKQEIENVNEDSLKRKNEVSINNENEASQKKTKTEILFKDRQTSCNLDEQDSPAKFNIKEEILAVLSRKESILLSKLEKRVWKKYSVCSDVDSEKFKKKFDKKLKRISNIVIENERVSLKSED